MYGQSVFIFGIGLAGDQRQKICNAGICYSVALGVYILIGHFANRIRDLAYLLRAKLYLIRLIGHSLKENHLAALACSGAFYGIYADRNRLGKVCCRCEMSRATLGKIKLNRAHLTAKFLLDRKLKSLCGSRKILMTKNVGASALRSLSYVAAVSEAYALGHRNHDVRVLCKCHLK